MDIWLYLTICTLAVGGLDILSTIIGITIRDRYPGYTRRVKIKEQNPLLGQFVDRELDGKSKPWQYKLFGYTLVTEQKLVYILIAHLLVIHVSDYLCIFLAALFGWYVLFALINSVMIGKAIKEIRSGFKYDTMIQDLAEIFQAGMDANSEPGAVENPVVAKLIDRSDDPGRP